MKCNVVYTVHSKSQPGSDYGRPATYLPIFLPAVPTTNRRLTQLTATRNLLWRVDAANAVTQRLSLSAASAAAPPPACPSVAGSSQPGTAAAVCLPPKVLQSLQPAQRRAAADRPVVGSADVVFCLQRRMKIRRATDGQTDENTGYQPTSPQLTKFDQKSVPSVRKNDIENVYNTVRRPKTGKLLSLEGESRS